MSGLAIPLGEPDSVQNAAFHPTLTTAENNTPTQTGAPQGGTAGTGLGAFGAPRAVFNPSADPFSVAPGSFIYQANTALASVSKNLTGAYGNLAQFVPYSGDPTNPVAPWFAAMTPAAQLAFLQQQQKQFGTAIPPMPGSSTPTAASIAAGIKAAGGTVVSDPSATAQGFVHYDPSGGYSPAAGIAPVDKTPTSPGFSAPNQPGQNQPVSSATGSPAGGKNSTAAAAAAQPAGAPGTSGTVTPATAPTSNHFLILIAVAIALILLTRGGG